MPSPFPGMDPYLENPEIFPDFHDSILTYLREALQARLPEPYIAVLGRRVWIEVSHRAIGPDVEVRRAGSRSPRRTEPGGALAIANAPVARPVVVKVAHDEFREPFIEIRARHGDGQRLVASIEVLSPANKSPGEQGHELYKRKQKEILASQVHLVEIDFLRGGEHTTAVPLDLAREACGPFDYHVSVHGFDDLETYHVYPIRLEDRLLQESLSEIFAAESAVFGGTTRASTMVVWLFGSPQTSVSVGGDAEQFPGLGYLMLP